MEIVEMLDVQKRSNIIRSAINPPVLKIVNLNEVKSDIVTSNISKPPTLNIIDPKYPYGKTKSGQRKCVHNVYDYICKKCPGKGICKHNKIKGRCKDCNGTDYCKHKKRKEYCKECGGSQLCEHNRRKNRCKECGGSQLCEHNIEKSQCKKCGGSSICEHDKIRSRCKECGGGSICEHDKIRSRCKECGGSQICEHNRERGQCRECGGRQICEHKRLRSCCKECRRNLPLEYVLSRHKNACLICGAETTSSKQKHHKMCVDCMDPNEKRPEIIWREIIENNFGFKPSMANENVYTKGCKLGKYRPDLTFHTPNLIIILELDEMSHSSYDVSCEITRTVNMKDAYPDQKILFIRMNPDKNDEVPEELETLESRTCYMLGVMKQYLDTNNDLYDELDDKITNVIYLFYGDGGKKHIMESIKHPENVKIIDTHFCMNIPNMDRD